MRWRLAMVGVPVLGASIVWPPTILVLAVLVPAGWWYPAYRQTRFGIGRSGDQLIVRTGVITEKVHVTRVVWIEEISIRRSLGQRRRGLATLKFSGIGSGSRVRVPDLDEAVARELAWSLAIESNQALAQQAAHGEDLVAETGLPEEVDALWRWYAVLSGLLLAAVLTVPWVVSRLWWDWIPTIPVEAIAASSVLLVGVIWVLAPHARWRWSYRVAARTILAAYGVMVHRAVALRRSRVQLVETSSDPLERRFGLTTVTVRTPGESDADLVLPHLPAESVERIREALSGIPWGGSAVSEE